MFAIFMLYGLKFKLNQLSQVLWPANFKVGKNLPKSTNLEEGLKVHLEKFTNSRKIRPFRWNLPVWIGLNQFKAGRINQFYADFYSHDLSSSESRSFVVSGYKSSWGPLHINITLKLGVQYLIWWLGFKQDCKLGKRLLKMDPFLVSFFFFTIKPI